MGSKLAYTPEFKQFVRQNPGLIRKFIQAYKSKAEECDFGDVSIKKIKDKCPMHESCGHKGWAHKNLWRVDAGNRAFFVKETFLLNLYGSFQGYDQFDLIRRLSSQIKRGPIRFAEPHLGFTGRYTGFLVTDFHDLPTLCHAKKTERNFTELIKMHCLSAALLMFAVVLRLMGISDIKEFHAFYDKANGRLILFDPMHWDYSKGARSIPSA